MHRTASAILLALLSVAGAGLARGEDKAPRLADVEALQDVLTEAVKKAEPSVACILVCRSDDKAQQQHLDDPDTVPEAYGSGVVIDEKGLVLTNLHVVREATRIYVRLPGGKGSVADIYAGDPRSDLAVLRLQDPKVLPLKPIPMGDGGAVRKGQFVLALSNPFAAGFRDGNPSVSWGILSNLRRRAPSKPNEEANYKTLHQFGTLLQTDARMNLGCSGGALIDLKGELIGLTTALAAIYGGETPGGFAVPMDAGMRRIIDVLKRGEEVEYGFLGVGFMSQRPEEVVAGEGVTVGNVVPGSPAYTAGLRPRDVLLAVNGTRVQTPDDLFLALGTLLAGSTAKLEIVRAGGPHRSETVSVTLAKFYVPGKVIATRRPPAVAGLRVDYTSILCQRPGGLQTYIHGIPPGVMIREVVEGSAADTARLQEGKVIREVNGHRVLTPDDFYREMQSANGATAELTVVSPEGHEDRVKIDLK